MKRLKQFYNNVERTANAAAVKGTHPPRPISHIMEESRRRTFGGRGEGGVKVVSKAGKGGRKSWV